MSGSCCVNEYTIDIEVESAVVQRPGLWQPVSVVLSRLLQRRTLNARLRGELLMRLDRRERC